MHYVDSSNIAQVGYDAATSELHIEFTSGSTYVYEGVPDHLFGQLLDADSKGGFFNREIKNTYPFRKL